MSISLAFETRSPHSSMVLWRLTTKPWARARRGIAYLPRHPMRHVVEASITVLSMAGMVFISLACLAA